MYEQFHKMYGNNRRKSVRLYFLAIISERISRYTAKSSNDSTNQRTNENHDNPIGIGSG